MPQVNGDSRLQLMMLNLEEQIQQSFRRSMSILSPKGLKMALNKVYLAILSISPPLKHLSRSFFNLHPHSSQRFSLSYL